MKNTTNPIRNVAAVLGLALVFSTHSAIAAVAPVATSNGSFIVLPAKIEVDLVPGETATREILIANNTGKRADFVLSVEDVSGTRGGSETVQFLGASNGTHTLKEMVSLSAKTVTVENGAEVRVPFSLALVNDAEPGGHYGAVFVTAYPEGAPQGASVASRIGVLVFVRVPGNQTEKASLKNFSTKNDASFFAKGVIPFEILFENEGNVHVNPYGKMTVTNMFGTNVAEFILDPWFALPNSVRTREVVWQDANAFGAYTATLELNRGYQDIVDIKKVSFVILPFWFVVSVIVFLGALIWFLRQKYFPKKQIAENTTR